MEVLRVWIEWEFGQDEVVFLTRAAAEKWVEDVLEGSIDETREELEDEGLISYQWLEVKG